MCLVLFQDIRLHGTPDHPQGICFDPFINFRLQHLVTGDTEQQGSETVILRRQRCRVRRARNIFIIKFFFQQFFNFSFQAMLFDVFFTLLVDSGIEEEGRHNGCGAVDGHGYGCGRIGKIKSGIQLLGIVERANTDA